MLSSDVLRQLSKFLKEERAGIVEQFVAAVRIEPELETTDHLDKVDVANHLTELLDSLSEDLSETEETPRSKKATDNAKAHGRVRWQQHCKLAEVLREYAVLRRVLMFKLVEFEKLQPQFREEDRRSAARTLHSLLDDVMIVSATEFYNLGMAENDERSHLPGSGK